MAMQVCPACKGQRFVPTSSGAFTCPMCGGSGQAEPDYVRKPRDYPIDVVIGAAGPPGTFTLNINAETDFELFAIVSTQTIAYTVAIRESSGRNWSDTPINNANFAGTAQLPFFFPVPVLLAAKSSLQFTFTDPGGAGLTLQLVFRGYDLYPVAG